MLMHAQVEGSPWQRASCGTSGDGSLNPEDLTGAFYQRDTPPHHNKHSENTSHLRLQARNHKNTERERERDQLFLSFTLNLSKWSKQVNTLQNEWWRSVFLWCRLYKIKQWSRLLILLFKMLSVCFTTPQVWTFSAIMFFFIFWWITAVSIKRKSLTLSLSLLSTAEHLLHES